jgi:5-methylthioribose kinase
MQALKYAAPKSLALQYAGVEILRRILGVAQLPGSLSLETKRDLLKRSREFVLAVPIEGVGDKRVVF